MLCIYYANKYDIFMPEYTAEKLRYITKIKSSQLNTSVYSSLEMNKTVFGVINMYKTHYQNETLINVTWSDEKVGKIFAIH